MTTESSCANSRKELGESSKETKTDENGAEDLRKP